MSARSRNVSAQTGDICALCKHFKMKQYPKHAEIGLGRCMGYDNTAAPLINPFHTWSTKACSRFKPDWVTMADRKAWVEKQQAKQPAQAAQE